MRDQEIQSYVEKSWATAHRSIRSQKTSILQRLKALRRLYNTRLKNPRFLKKQVR